MLAEPPHDLGLLCGLAHAPSCASRSTSTTRRTPLSITAELGTMKVTEQIDAMEVLAIDPMRYLVMPRIVAMRSAEIPCGTSGCSSRR